MLSSRRVAGRGVVFCRLDVRAARSCVSGGGVSARPPVRWECLGARETTRRACIKPQGSAIGTLVEWQTRMAWSWHLPFRDGDTLHEALKARMDVVPPGLLRSITWDQRTEIAPRLQIPKSLGLPVFFGDSRPPGQRGSNENTTGLLRNPLAKSTDLHPHTQEHLFAAEDEHNGGPCLVLGDRSPAGLFTALLTPQNRFVLQRWNRVHLGNLAPFSRRHYFPRRVAPCRPKNGAKQRLVTSRRLRRRRSTPRANRGTPHPGSISPASWPLST